MKPLFYALSKTNDGAFVVNEKHKIIFWNQAAQEILGFTADEVLNRPCYQVMRGRTENESTFCRHFCHLHIGAYQGDTLPTMDAFMQTKAGSWRWINLTTVSFPISNGHPEYLLVHLFRDATQKKRNERVVDEIVSTIKGLKAENSQPDLKTKEVLPPDSDYENLTPREREVLLLLARGLGTEEMSDLLSISPATTRNHIQNTLSKLNVHSRVEAMSYAYQQGLIGLSS